MRTGLAQNLSNWRLFSFFARLRLTYESCLVKRMCVIMWNGTTESVPSSYRTYTLCTSLLYIDCNLWKYILSVTGKMKHYVTFNHCYQRIREVNSAHIHGNNIPSLLYGEELYGCSVAKLQKQLQVSRNVTAKSEKKNGASECNPKPPAPPLHTHTHTPASGSTPKHRRVERLTLVQCDVRDTNARTVQKHHHNASAHIMHYTCGHRRKPRGGRTNGLLRSKAGTVAVTILPRLCAFVRLDTCQEGKQRWRLPVACSSQWSRIHLRTAMLTSHILTKRHSTSQ